MHGQAAQANAVERCGAERAGLRGAQTPQSIWARIQKDGAAGLREALGKWKLWVPPKQGQARAPGPTAPCTARVRAGATATTAVVPPACAVHEAMAGLQLVRPCHLQMHAKLLLD